MQNKAKIGRRKENKEQKSMKVKTKQNRTIEKNNEIELCSLKRSLKSINFQQDEQRYKEKTKFTNVRNKTGNSTTDLADSKRQSGKCYKQLHMHNCHNLDVMD